MEKEIKNLSKEELLEIIDELQSENDNFRHCLECIRCFTSLDIVSGTVTDILFIEQSSDFYDVYLSSMAAINISCNKCLG